MLQMFRSAGRAIARQIGCQARQVYGRGWQHIALLAMLAAVPAFSAAPQFSVVTPERPIVFPADFGAHPDFRTEWWYATGWLTTPDGKPLGFQLTFFRSGTDHDQANPSRFAPKQLIIAHAALSDPAAGKLQHDQRVAREGFGLSFARIGNTDVRLDDWTLQRLPDGVYRARIAAADFTLAIDLTPTQAPMLQGEQGFSRKGARPGQASHYYSQPHLKVSGNVIRAGKPVAVAGSAWLDHECRPVTSIRTPAAGTGSARIWTTAAR